MRLRFAGWRCSARITSEDPANNFTPDYGRITSYRSPAGYGVRLDGGTAYAGAVITPYFDSLLVKLTCFGSTFDEVIARTQRALAEFRIRGCEDEHSVFAESGGASGFSVGAYDDDVSLIRRRRCLSFRSGGIGRRGC